MHIFKYELTALKSIGQEAPYDVGQNTLTPTTIGSTAISLC